jgi:hypothetical protein
VDAVPGWLAWLLPVPVATLSAIAWAAWRARPRGPVDPRDSVADYERFRRALGTDGPERRR